MTQYKNIAPYITRDGSIIRELMHPAVHGNRGMSIAEATVPPGAESLLHRHAHAEELYHFTSGSGIMQLGDERFPVLAGDTVCIPPGTLHSLRNTGCEELRVICACCPPYSHDDTEVAATA